MKYFSDFSEKQLEQFRLMDAVYREWNEKINVISRKDIDTLYEHHVLHSLAIAALCPFDDGAEVIDIGTGGGFPGIPLAVFFPKVNFVLMDGIGKKITVVNEVVQALGLTNVEAVKGRVEEIKGRKFDYAVSRAVAPLSDLWRWISPSLQVGQKSDELPNGLISLKGGNLTQEIGDTGLKKIIQAWKVGDFFQEEFFQEKYMIYVPKLVK